MTCELFRYCWIKVTDEDGRAAAIRAALDLQQTMMEEAHTVTPGSPEADALARELDMARTYLGEEVDAGVRVVIVMQQQITSLQVLGSGPEARSTGGVEVAMADMPVLFTREQAQAWLETRVGSTWSHGALACRLIYAVASIEEEVPMVAPATHGAHAANHA